LGSSLVHKSWDINFFNYIQTNYLLNLFIQLILNFFFYQMMCSKLWVIFNLWDGINEFPSFKKLGKFIILCKFSFDLFLEKHKIFNVFFKQKFTCYICKKEVCVSNLCILQIVTISHPIRSRSWKVWGFKRFSIKMIRYGPF
jgi:hypothetical protein